MPILTEHHSAYCDNCGWGPIIGPRVVCLDCPRMSNGRVDLCPTVRCMSPVLEPGVAWGLGGIKHHLLSHCLLRLPRVLYIGQEASVLGRAKDAIERAKRLVPDKMEGQKNNPSTSKSQDFVGRLCCIACRKETAIPFWYCIDCTGKRMLFTYSPVLKR